jgi:hypothetical protein
MLLIFLFFFASARAITTSEIGQLAIEHSASLRAEEMEARALGFEANTKSKWQNPQLMGQFGNLKSGSVSGATAEVSFTQSIPLSNKFSLRRELAEAAMAAQGERTQNFKIWVQHQAQLSAWKLYIAQELFSHGVERAKRLALVKKYMETRPRVSARQRVELSLIASTLLQLERMQDERAHALTLAMSDLEFWTGKVIAPEELDLKIPESPQLITIDDTRFEEDLELKAAKRSLEIATIDKEMAQKDRRPDLFVGAGYRLEDVTPVNHFSYGIVGLNIPLWDNGTDKVETTGARLIRDQRRLTETNRRVELRHKQQAEAVRFAMVQLKRFPKRFITTSESAIHEAERGFKQGLLDVNTFLQSETQSHEVIDQVVLAWVAYLENVSAWQLMRGEEFRWNP